MKLSALIFAFLICVALASPVAATSLTELAEKYSAGWMVGKWKGATENGGEVKLEYEWRLEKNAIGVKVALPQSNAEGFLAVKPGTDEVVYGTIDDKGGTTMGKLAQLNGNLVLKLKHTNKDGEERNMAVEYVKVDENKMKIRLYKMDDNGEIDTSENIEMEMTREKDAAKEPAKEKEKDK